MDITLIKQADSSWNRIHKKEVISDTGIVTLSDCSIILLHKADMRPLYVSTVTFWQDDLELHVHPQQKTAVPDLLLFSNAEAGKQSARVVQEQLSAAGCSTKILGMDFSALDKINNFEIYKQTLLTRLNHLEESGYKHVVVIADGNNLDKIAHCISGEGINPNYNFPIYSFPNRQNEKDENLIQNMYMTREMLDLMLIRRLNAPVEELEQDLKPYHKKCRPMLEVNTIKHKIKIYE